MISKVAVIGVGAMGAPMTMNIHKAGFELTVSDRSDAAWAMRPGFMQPRRHLHQFRAFVIDSTQGYRPRAVDR